MYIEVEAIFEGLPSGEAIERLEAANIANARIRMVRDFLDHPPATGAS